MNSERSFLNERELDEIGPGQTVYVQTKLWGPPEIGKYIGKCSTGGLTVELENNPGVLSNVPKDGVYANWIESVKEQLDIVRPKKAGRNLMWPLAKALLDCMSSEYLPTCENFCKMVREASSIADQGDLAEDVKSD